MICGLSQTELQSLVLSVGTHRGHRRLSPMEVATLLRQAMEAGTSRQALSESLKISEIQVSRFIRLFDLEPELRDLADWGRGNAATIPFSALLEIVRLAPSQQFEVAESALTHKLTKAEFRQISQISERSGRHINDCIADVIGRRPQVQVQFVLIGSIQQNELQEYLETLLQNTRDCLLKEVLDRLGPPSQAIQGRLGSKMFTFLAGKDIVGLLDMDPDAIEAFVNEHLTLLVQDK